MYLRLEPLSNGLYCLNLESSEKMLSLVIYSAESFILILKEEEKNMKGIPKESK